MSSKLKVGISGGIGSGKSYVSNLLEEKGFPVYNADARAKELMNSNPVIREALTEAFGEEVFIDNQLNRPFLANIIFNAPERREWVNSVVHPVVYADFAEWANEQTSNIVFQENAVMFDTGSYRKFDKTILVFADLETRIRRTMLRDNSDRKDVQARINSQGNPEEHKKLADFVIDNSEGKDVEQQLEAILQSLI
jgi:dephospho-CoA kinase